MKTNTHPLIASFLLLFLFIFHTNLFATTRSKKIDPVRFTITTDASFLSTNEEFEIKITAKYLSINPNLVYVFDGANSFKLKLTMPDGFKQTGGNYSDFVGTELTSTKPSVTYTVKGKFTSETQGGTFQLLRSHRSAGSQSEFVQVGALAFTTLSTSKDTLSPKNARIAVINPNYVPYMSLSEFRSGTGDSSNVIYINEGGRSGIFQFKAGDTTTPDDTSMVLVHGTRRYFREAGDYAKPEWWGAKRDGTTDDWEALQKTFNYASTHNGIKLELGVGTYLIGKTLKFKRFVPFDVAYSMHVNIQGAGIDLTRLQGTETFTGNLIEMNTGEYNFADRDNWVFINNLRIIARGADRCLYANYVSGLRITDVSFIGGEKECIKLGSEVDLGLNYSIYLTRCAFVGATTNGGNSNGNIIANNVLFLYIEGMEGDGGRYGIYMNNCSDATIFGSKIEGYKKAAIYIDGTNGAPNHKIYGNYISTYAGFDKNNIFDGTMYGILIKGTFPFACDVSGNNFRVAESAQLPFAIRYTSATNLHASADGDIITGVSSGATGYLQGIKPGNIMLVQMISGTFSVGENFTHKYNGNPQGNGVIGTITGNTTYTIKLEGDYGNNSIRGNHFTTMADYGIHATSAYNSIVSNGITGKIGVYINKPGSVMGNNFYTTGVTIDNAGGLASVSGNVFSSGSIVGSQNNFVGGVKISGGTDISGTVTVNSLPVYADNTAASSGGLAVGALYRTSTGDVKVRY